MSVIASLIRAGIDPELIIEVADALAAAHAAGVAAGVTAVTPVTPKRNAHAARQAAYRERKASQSVTSDAKVTPVETPVDAGEQKRGVTKHHKASRGDAPILPLPEPSLEKERSPTPPKENTTLPSASLRSAGADGAVEVENNPGNIAPLDPETFLFSRGKQVFGKRDGGAICAKLKKLVGIGRAIGLVEEAAQKYEPVTYIRGVIAKREKGDLEKRDFCDLSMEEQQIRNSYW